MDSRFAVSTCCRSGAEQRGEELLERMSEIGVSRLELEYRITSEMFRRMRPQLNTRGFRIVSIHNFFPHPPGIPRSRASGDLFNFASEDGEERNLAVKQTLVTLQTAADLEVSRVVLHCGFIQDLADEAMEMRETWKQEGSLAEETVHSFLNARKGHSRRCVDRLLFALEKLIRTAEDLGVALGLENRAHPHELPSHAELTGILATFEGAPLDFWFDLGHAAHQQVLGFHPMDPWIELASKSLLGMHVHDCDSTGRDHLPPGTGTMDFKRLSPVLKQAPLLVFEIEPEFTAEAIRQGMAFIESRLTDSSPH